VNRGELVKRVGQKLGFAWDVTGDEQDFLRDLASEGVTEVLMETRVYVKIGDASLVSGQAEYRLDDAILAIDDGKGSTPAGIGPYDLISLSEMIQRQSAGIISPTFRKAIAIEGNLLLVSPTPETDETLTFYYVPRPLPLADDSHDPSNDSYGGIPTWGHRAIEYYMLWQAAEWDDKEHALSPKDYYQLFVAECKKIEKRKRNLRSRFQLRPRVGYPESRRPPYSRNDIYPPY